MAYETLIVEVEDHTCLIRLNRPEAMIALETSVRKNVAQLSATR